MKASAKGTVADTLFSFESHTTAIEHYAKNGTKYAVAWPGFDADSFSRALGNVFSNACLRVRVVDLTPLLSTECKGNTYRWVRAIDAAVSSGVERHDLVFVTVRSKENTPSMVHAVRAMASSVNVNAAEAAPAVFAVFRGQVCTIPMRIGCGSATVTAELLATVMGVKKVFRCVVCSDPLSGLEVGEDTSFDDIVLLGCEHAVHASCILDELVAGKNECARCARPVNFAFAKDDTMTPVSTLGFAVAACAALHTEAGQNAGFLRNRFNARALRRAGARVKSCDVDNLPLPTVEPPD